MSINPACARYVLGSEPFMLKGISTGDDDQLQRKANNLERQLLRRAVPRPEKLLGAFSASLKKAGFVRIRVKWSNAELVFQAELGRELAARLCGLSCLTNDHLLNSRVISAARRCGFDPRIEDVGTWLTGSRRVEGVVRPVPFVLVTAALDKMLHRLSSSYSKPQVQKHQSEPARGPCQRRSPARNKRTSKHHANG